MSRCKIIQIYEKYRPQQVIKTHWILPKYHSIHYGTNLLAKIVGKAKFSYPKSLFAVSDVVRLFTKENDIILDFLLEALQLLTLLCMRIHYITKIENLF